MRSSLGVVIVGVASPVWKEWRWDGTLREILLEQLLVFMVTEFLLVFGTSPLGDLAPSLATDGTLAPDHGRSD